MGSPLRQCWVTPSTAWAVTTLPYTMDYGKRIIFAKQAWREFRVGKDLEVGQACCSRHSQKHPSPQFRGYDYDGDGLVSRCMQNII